MQSIGFKYLMKKIAIPIIIGVTAAIAAGIAYAGLVNEEPIVVNTPKETSNVENQPSLGHPGAITSGPLTITQYQHKIYENIFMIVSGLAEDEKGNITVFMPDGRLYKTIQYDGSVKDGFNVYFKPDTSFARKICEQEELVGRWLVVFDNNVYPPLVFEIINEHLSGPDVRLPKSC
jgi:hypothetical protein